MVRLHQIVAPAILSAAMLVGTQGCSTAERPDSVPTHAQMISEGKETVAAAAPHDGMVYVTDSTDNKLVYSGKVEQGDSVQLDAKKDKILLNDKVAMESGLSNGDHYKIYFERSTLPDAQLSSQRQTIIQPAPAQTYNNNYGTTPGSNNNATPNNGATVIQPAPAGNGATITQPNGTVVQPNGNVVQPNGTEVKQGENGSSTDTPSR